MTPPCANWKIWVGNEIEGHTEVGEKTLFIREAAESIASLPKESLTHKGTISRVWFCKEFRNWKVIYKLSKLFKTVCIEATPGTLDAIPPALRLRACIYLKVELILKEGDHICVGPPFADESFRLGTGNKVNPKLYEQDRKIA